MSCFKDALHGNRFHALSSVLAGSKIIILGERSWKENASDGGISVRGQQSWLPEPRQLCCRPCQAPSVTPEQLQAEAQGINTAETPPGSVYQGGSSALGFLKSRGDGELTATA